MGGDPDAEDRDVNQGDRYGKHPFELLGFAPVGHDQGDTVSDDLREKLGLNSP